MAVSVLVQNPLKQIIVPVRFDRAVRGAPVLDAPDVDDRGFVLKTPGGLNVTNARGAMFGITVGDTVRVKVVRDDLDATAPLFVTVAPSGNPQLRIVAPAGGGPLPPDGVFSIEAIADNTTPQKIHVRLGSATGPIVGEADPHTFSLLTLNITPHIWKLHASAGAPGAGTEPTVNGNPINLTTLFDIARTVWRPMGIGFNVNPERHDELFGAPVDNTVTRDNAAPLGSDADLVDHNFAANTCNIHFIRFTPGYLGIGVRRELLGLVGFKRPGIIVGVEGFRRGDGTFQNRSSAGAQLEQEIGNDLAHEIGHFLTLPHSDNQNSGTAPSDTYRRRQLMHPVNLLPLAATSGARFDDIGYGVTAATGRGHRGCLLLMKNHTTNASASECISTRRRFRVNMF
jgi:hypothetical protein